MLDLGREGWLVDVFAVVVSVVSAGVAVASLALTTRRLNAASRAAVVAFRAQILRNQVVVDPAVAEWSIGGVHDSVRELRDDLARALAGLPARELLVGERAIVDCVELLVALRPWATNEDAVADLMRDHSPALDAHSSWKAKIEGPLTALGTK